MVRTEMHLQTAMITRGERGTEPQNGSSSRDSVVGRRQVLKIAGGIGTAGLTGLSGCTGITGNSDGGGGNNDKLVVGIMIPMSGQFSSLGSLYRPAYEAWGKIINERGGINGHSIKLRFEDNQSSESRTSKIASQFASDGVAFMINAYSSPLTRAAAPVAEQNQIPLMSTGSVNPKIHAGFNYVFEFEPPLDQKGAAAVLGKKTPLQKVATWAVDLGWAKIGMDIFNQEYASKYGFDVVYSATHPRDEKNFSSFVLKAKNSGAQALATFNYPPHVISQTRAINVSNWEPKFISEVTATSMDIYKALGPKLTQGMGAPTVWNRSLPFEGNELFLKTFKKTAPEEISADYHSALGFGSLQVFGEAVKALNSDTANGPKLRDWFAKSKVQTILGTSKFDDRGVQVGISWKEIQWHDKNTPFIYPPELKVADLIYPKPWP